MRWGWDEEALIELSRERERNDDSRIAVVHSGRRRGPRELVTRISAHAVATSAASMCGNA